MGLSRSAPFQDLFRPFISASAASLGPRGPGSPGLFFRHVLHSRYSQQKLQELQLLQPRCALKAAPRRLSAERQGYPSQRMARSWGAKMWRPRRGRGSLKKRPGRSLNPKPSFTPKCLTRTITIAVIIGFLHCSTENNWSQIYVEYFYIYYSLILQ